jgi:hypothetical protein
MNEEQEKKKAKRTPTIGSLKEQFATFGNADGGTVERLDSDTVGTPDGSTVEQLDSDTVKASKRETVLLSNSSTVEQLERATVAQPHSETVPPLNSSNVSPLHRSTVKTKKERKVSFYLTPEQESKLYDLEIACYQQYGKRINRNDIVRYLIEQCMFESLSGLMLQEGSSND